MKKVWFRIGVIALSVMGMLVATGGEALAWGPVTHQKIVAEARDEMAESGIKELWLAYPRYMYGGAIAPDWCLAYATAESGAEDVTEVAAHQDDFHSPEFLTAMETLADTGEEEAFYYAYKSHVISDEDEERFGATVASGPSDYALEFYVDRMLVSEGYCGEVDIGICAELMVAAYQVAFPDSAWQPTVSQIMTLYDANWAYQIFWLPYIAEINVEKGYRYYSDYTSFMDTSIKEVSLMSAEK
jgi:hypothetical protein